MFKIRRAESTSLPETVEMLQGKKLIRVNIKKETRTDETGNPYTVYIYAEVEGHVNTDVDYVVAKYGGEIYNNIERVSFTSHDALGVLQLKAAFEAGVLSTVLHIANGNLLPITSQEFLAFSRWFVAKRNQFFV